MTLVATGAGIVIMFGPDGAVDQNCELLDRCAESATFGEFAITSLAVLIGIALLYIVIRAVLVLSDFLVARATRWLRIKTLIHFPALYERYFAR